jgi:Domain of unknown function (DUF4886)
MRLLFRIFLLLTLTDWSFAAQAQTNPVVTNLGPSRPNNAIFIGNSYFYYNGGIPHHVTLLEEAADPKHKSKYRNVMAAFSSYRLSSHDVESYFRSDVSYTPSDSYTLSDEDRPSLGLLDKRFGAAIMMDCSQCPIHPKLSSAFTEYTNKDSAIVRAHGARPVLFMSWAYADRPEMMTLLKEAYTIVGNANAALVIPAGLAFARARQRQPELNLYTADKSHPSPAGTYLAACTTFAALTGRSPLGNPYHADLDEPTARLLQEVAWDTVRDYFRK